MKLSLVRLMIGLAFAVGAIVAFRDFHHSGIAVIAIVIFTYLSLLIVTFAIMLDYPRLPLKPRANKAVDKLEKQTPFLHTSFSADRAFRVAECNEEGPHYFLELENGGILHLSSNYLYDYEPGNGHPRLFPCTRFTVRRHAELGHLVDILCSGLIIEPEFEAPPYTAWDFAHGMVPCDGQILSNLTFDQLRRQFSRSRDPLPLHVRSARRIN